MINNRDSATDKVTLSISSQSVMSVFEHQRLVVQDFAYATDFDWLLTQEFAVFSIKRQQGHWQLKVGHYIGIVMLPSGITLEILPKPIAAEPNEPVLRGAKDAASFTNRLSPSNISKSNDDIALTRQWVQQMLSDLLFINNGKPPSGKHLGQLSNHISPLFNQSPLPLSEWLVAQFLQLLAGYQPLRHYQIEMRNQPMLQGKLVIKEQLRRNPHQPHKFVSEVSHLSKDMLANRLIKTALHWLQPWRASLELSAWRSITALNQHELRQLEKIYLQAKRELAVQPITQQLLRAAQKILDLAYWLLRQANINTGSSLNPARMHSQVPSQPRLCLLINMNQAFEQWASQRVASTLNQQNNNYQPLYQSQHSWLQDKSGQTRLSIRPDLLIYHTIDPSLNKEGAIDSRTDNAYSKRVYSHVIDIKWKYLAPSSISTSDAYQLSSYAQAYQAEQVWLIYPVIGNTIQPVALQQTLHDQTITNELWLMPFNVLTAELNN